MHTRMHTCTHTPCRWLHVQHDTQHACLTFRYGGCLGYTAAPVNRTVVARRALQSYYYFSGRCMSWGGHRNKTSPIALLFLLFALSAHAGPKHTLLCFLVQTERYNIVLASVGRHTHTPTYHMAVLSLQISCTQGSHSNTAAHCKQSISSLHENPP